MGYNSVPVFDSVCIFSRRLTVNGVGVMVEKRYTWKFLLTNTVAASCANLLGRDGMLAQVHCMRVSRREREGGREGGGRVGDSRREGRREEGYLQLLCLAS